MRAIAKFLTFVTLLALLAGGYVYWASALKTESAGFVVESAADRAQAFNGILSAMQADATGLTLYTTDVNPAPEQYLFLTYTLRVRNLNLLQAEWLQLTLETQDGDVLMVDPAVEDVPALNEKLITVVLLTNRNTAGYERDARLDYYVYGHPMSIPVRLGA